jgi:hypothetical protein
MSGRDVRSWKGYLATSMVMAALLLLATSLLSVAQEPEPGVADKSAISLDESDDGIAETGTEWIAEFPECYANNIPCEEPQCMGFYNDMFAAGWGGGDSFHFGNAFAWAQDFERAAAGGTENAWVDDVDILLFCDHGTTAFDSYWDEYLSALHFGCKDADGDCQVTPGEAYLSYGDGDLEWLGLKACSVLSDYGPYPYYNRGYWASTMNGLHQILGFRNSSYCHNDFGELWATCMLGIWWDWLWLLPPQRVTQAWFDVVDDTQPGGVCARVLAEEEVFFNDYLWGRGDVNPDFQDGDYVYLDHCVFTPPPVPPGAEAVAQLDALPIVKVVPRDVTKDYALEVAKAFATVGSDIREDSEKFYFVQATDVVTCTLQVDKLTGSYKYRNATMLWSAPKEAPDLPDSQEALYLTDRFFSEQGDRLPAAAYRTGEIRVRFEELVEELKPVLGEADRAEEVELGRKAIDVAVSYGRVLDVEAVTARGVEAVEVPVVGPGARTTIYLGDEGEILGVQGGSRDVDVSEDTVPILDADEVWKRFLEDPGIALLPPPGAYEGITRLAETLAYYEHAYGNLQEALIPTWVFSTTVVLGSGGGEAQTQGTWIYVPASEQFMPPQVDILTPADGETFLPGEPVTLSGIVTEYGTGPFTYEWYSSYQGFLGTGHTLGVTLLGALSRGELTTHTITLHVTDANGQQGSDAVEVKVQTNIYLPVILKGY